MEDVIAFVIIGAILALFIWGAVTLIKRVKREQALEAERRAKADAFWAEQRSKRNKVEVPESMKQYVAALGSKPEVKPTKQPKTETIYTPDRWAPTTRTQQSSDDGFVTGMLTGMLVDSVVNSITHKSEPSLGVTKTESSWGFDDADSRKSISDSMSDSWSSSSSSSDSWSSSDSGPSSDW